MSHRAGRWWRPWLALTAVVALAACGGGGGGGQGLGSGQPTTSRTSTPSTEGVTTSTDVATTTSTVVQTTTTQRATTTTTAATTTTTAASATTSTTAPTTTTSQATAPTQGALPPATTPVTTGQEADSSGWWLLLLIALIVVIAIVLWTRRRAKTPPIDDRWRTRVDQLATDMDTVSHLLVAGSDPVGAIADDRWTGVLNRSDELRRLAPSLAAEASSAELRDALVAPVDALRSLELDADAARAHVVGASAAVRADADSFAAALIDLRTALNPSAKAH